MKVRWAGVALLALPGLALPSHAVAATAAASTSVSSTGALNLCVVEDKTGVAAITVSPASRQDGRAHPGNGTVVVDVAPGATTAVTYTNQS